MLLVLEAPKKLRRAQGTAAASAKGTSSEGYEWIEFKWEMGEGGVKRKKKKKLK